MSGEQISVTSRLIFTSGKCGIWPLAAPKNQGFVKLGIFQGRKERPRHKMHIKKTYGGYRMFPSMLEKENLFVVMSTVNVRQRNLWSLDGDYREGGSFSFPLWTHGQDRGWAGQVNLVVLFYGWVECGLHSLSMLCLWLLFVRNIMDTCT